MLTLFHNIMSTPSRFVRLALTEYEVETTLIEERPWAKRREFLAINPAGTLPVLLAEHNRRDARRVEARPAAVCRGPV
jgi:glutathione S-transferase